MTQRSTCRSILMIAAGVLMMAQLGLAAGIVDTKHNLRSSGSNTIKGANDEVGVYCHTPHHAQTNDGPLWNRTMSSASYTVYSSLILDATPANPSESISKAWLSCHDGTIGINQLTNMPGSGFGPAWIYPHR